MRRSDTQPPDSAAGTRAARPFGLRQKPPGDIPPAERHLWEMAAVRDIVVIAAIAFVFWFMYALSEIFSPLLIALVLAHVFNPAVTYAEENWRWPRPLSVALVLTIGVLSIVIFFAWLGPLLVGQATDLARRLPEYLRTITATYNVEMSELSTRVEESLRSFQLDPRQVLGQIFQTTGRALGIVTMIFSTATSLVLSLILVIVAFFFLCWHFKSGLHSLQKYIPENRRQRTLEIFSQMDDAIGQFFRGRLVIAVMMGVMLSAGWYFTGVPYWFVLGMLTGLLNIVPYLSIITWPLVIVLKYVDTLSGGGETADLVSIALWPSAVYVIVQLLEGWVLTPWIQSGQTNLNAPTIIVVVLIGAAVGGIMGMLFAIPVAACIKILLDEVALPRLRRWAAEH